MSTELAVDKTMLLGEYFLHIFVEETSSLFSGDGQGDIDVVIEVEAFGETKKTEKKEGIVYGTSAFYGEHFFYDQKFTERSVLDSQLVKIRVYNSKLLKTLVGSTEFSASSVYYEDEHAFRHRWFFLSNVQKDYQKIMGYVKISANFTRSNEKKALLTPETSEQTMMGQNIRQISIPPQFKLEKKQIQVNIYEADRLFLMDDHWTQGKGSDPYVKLYLGGSEVKTEYLSIKGVKTPMYWKLYVTLIYPTFIDQLSLSLKDYETGLKKNEVFGSKRFSVEEIKNGNFVNPFWCYIYGGPEYYEHKEVKDKMDQFPEIASTFKGSIYMSMKMIDAVSNSNFRKKMLEEEILKPPPKRFFKIRIEFYSVQNFHYEDNDDDDDHYMEVNWGGAIAKSKKVPIKNNLLEFYDYVELEEGFSCTRMEELPDMIVALTKYKSSRKKLRRVCYCRLRPEAYMARNRISDKYIFLNIDKSVSDVADDGAGILHFKMGVNPSDLWTPQQIENFNQNLQKPNPIPIMVAVNAFQAKELPAGDDNGSGDPVVQVYHYGTRMRSSIFLQTLNPVWNERIILATYAIGSFIPPVIINVHDYDPKDDEKKDPNSLRKEGKYEFLGNTCIFLGRKNKVKSINQIPEPEWHELKYSEESRMGRISLSVTLSLPEGQYFRSYVTRMKEDLEKHLVKIRILGMRNLQSTGLIPVKKPYIKINTTSLILRSGSNDDVPYAVLQTIPKQGGRDPNIGEILNLEVDLPSEDSLKPSISCEVLDQALFGTSEKSIGNFEIDIGYYSLFSKISLNQRLKLLKDMLQTENKRPDAIPILEKIMEELNSKIKHQGKRMLDAGTIQGEPIFKEKQSVANQIADYLSQKPGGGSKNHNEQQFAPKGVIQPSNTQLNNILELSDAKTSKFVEFNSSNKNNTITEASNDNFAMLKIRDEAETIAPQQADFDRYQDNIFVIKPKYKKVRVESTEKKDEAKEELDEELKSLNLTSEKRFVLKEYDIPDLKKYRIVGYDSSKRKAKHYRLKLDTALEDSAFIGKSEFDSIDIVRGKRIKSDTSFIEKFFNSKEQFKRVGIFKGGISCMSMKMINALGKLNLNEELDRFNIPYSKEGWENRQIDKDMLQKVKVQTRVYILEAQLYKSEDKYSKNDPYLIVNLGENEFNGRDEALIDRDFAIFNKRITFDHEFPGVSVLKIQVFDRDIAFDDVIGETEIDLEERFYDEKFRAMPEQPIERRKLFTADSGQEAGYVDLWVETFARRQKGDGIKEIEPILWDISSAPSQEFELRVVVWDTRDVPNDDPEDMSDIYVKVALNSLDNDLESTTDTHIRAADGFGSFNWRMKFPIKINAYSFLPEEKEKYRIDFQIWDKDLASFNDYLSSITIPFFHLIEEASANDSKAVMTKKEGSETKFDFYVKTRPNDKLKDKKLTKPSRIRISVELVPKDIADKNPVGYGRGPPNHSPYLPEPVGRFQMTLNPFKLIDRLVGPAFKRKCILLTCCFCYCFLFIMLLPIILGNILTGFFTR